MATEQIIQQQRKQIEEAKQRAQVTRQQRSKRELLSRQSGIAARTQRKSLLQAKQRASRQAIAKIKAQETKFEKEVAHKAPEYGKEVYTKPIYSQAIKSFQKKASELKAQIASREASLQRAELKGTYSSEQTHKSEGIIRELKAKLNPYSNILKQGKADIIKGFTSGSVESKSTYGGDVAYSKNVRHEENLNLAQSQGFSSYFQLQQAYKEQQKELKVQQVPGVSSQVLETPSPGTYDPKTGTYIDKQGQGFSTAIPPQGAKIVGGEKFDIHNIINPKYQSSFLEDLKKEEIPKPQEGVSIPFTPPITLKQKPNTYDPKTGIYIDKQGQGFSTAIPPPGTRVLGTQAPYTSKDPNFLGTSKDISLFPTSLQPNIIMDIIDKKVKAYKEDVKQETQRYKDFGYSPAQSKKLATESLKQGGVTFSPSGAEDILLSKGEKAGKWVEKKVKEGYGFLKRTEKKVFESEFGEKILSRGVPIFSGLPLIKVPLKKVTSFPAYAVEKIAEYTGKEWADIYSKTISKLPPEWQPSRVILGKEEEYKKVVEAIQRGELKMEDSKFMELVTPVVGEQFGEVIATGLKTIPFLVPGGGEVMLVSGVFKAREEYLHPEKEVEKEFKIWWKEYKEYEPPEGYEKLYTTEVEARKGVIPEMTLNVKEGALSSGLKSALTLGGIIAMRGISKGYDFFGKKVKTIKPLRKLKEGRKLLLEEKKIIGEKGTLKLQKYSLWGEKKPPMVEIKTTKAREFFKRKPLETKYIPSETYKQYSYNPFTGKRWVPSKGDSFAVQIESHKKYGTLFKVSGESVPRDLESFMKLSSRERWEWKKLAEKITGKALPEKMTPKFFKETSLKIKGETISQRIFRFKKRGKEGVSITTPWKEGKSITQTEEVLLQTPLKYEGDINLFKIKQVSKDVTKPFSRATGEVSYTKGIIVEHKPIVLKGGDVSGGTPSGIIKTPFEKTFGIQETKLISKLKFPSPPKPTKLTPLKTVVKREVSLVTFPRMVGGTGEVKSKYFGKGVYEVTEETGGLFTKSEITTQLDIKPKLIVSDKLKPLYISKPKITQIPREKITQIPIEKITPFVIDKPKELITQKFDLGFVSKLAERSIQVPRAIVRPSFVSPKIKVRPPRPIRPLKPMPKIPIILSGRYVRKTIKKKPIKKKPIVKKRIGYSFEVKRKGKWEESELPYAFATLEGAEAVAQKKVLGEAAASYIIVGARKGKKVISTGRVINPLENVLFRKGKGGTKVQKKLFRILSPGEKKEISYAGGLARKKSKPFLKSTLTKKTKSKKKTKKKKRK